MSSIFITGTDTSVGKTVVSAAIAAYYTSLGLRVCVYKPVQTGSKAINQPDDPTLIKQWLGDKVDTHCTFNFIVPAAPYVADVEGKIEFFAIKQDLKRLQQNYDLVLIEGAGGVRVPIAEGFEMIDLISMLNVPALVVSRPSLGTINHTLLTVDALLHREVNILGVIISGFLANTEEPAISELPRVLEAFLPVPLLGLLPPLNHFEYEEFCRLGQLLGNVLALPLDEINSVNNP